MMNRYALLINNVALNVIKSATDPGGNWVNVTGLMVGPGYTWDGSAWTPPAPPMPEAVSMRQARLALLQAGLLDQVQAAVDGMPTAAKITWEYAAEVRRDDPLTLQIASITGLTDEQIDSLFRTASEL